MQSESKVNVMTIVVNYEKTGTNIKKYRQNQNIKIDEMSKVTGISMRRLRTIENCSNSIKLMEITLICNHLNAKIEDILVYNVF